MRKKHSHAGVRPGKKPGSWVIDFYDHLSARHSKTFYGSEADAVKVRRAILAKVDRIKAGIEIAPEEKAKILTLYQLWEAFQADRQLKIQSGSMASKSLERVKNGYNSLLNYDSSLGAKRLDQLKAADFEAYKVYRKVKGFAPEGINTCLRTLRTIFNFAVDQEYIRKSPLAKVLMVKVTRGDVRFLNQDELRALDHTSDSIDTKDQFQVDARDLILFYLFTGARLSEGLLPTLTWANIGQDVIHFPITKAGKTRSIPMTDRLRALLESRKHLPDGPFKFTKNEAYKRIKWLLLKAGINNASPHTLRKTAGSLYYLATRDIFATSRFLGHSSVKVTESHYTGLIQSLQVEYAKKFEDVLSENLLHICYEDPKGHQPPPNDFDAVSSDLLTGKEILDGIN